MKRLKKMMALVIAMVMVLAMGMTVFADTPADDFSGKFPVRSGSLPAGRDAGRVSARPFSAAASFPEKRRVR